MKKRFILIVILLIVAVIIVTYRLYQRASGNVESHSDQANQPPVTEETNLSVLPSHQIVSTLENIAAKTKREMQMRRDLQQGQDEWRTPIAFYGKVVDGNNIPVPDAKIDFSCNDVSDSGTSYYHSRSDNNGLFSIFGINGKLLTVAVEKEGYYASKRDNAAFEYGDRYNHFVPDASNPVVFHLRKKGFGTELITSQKGISPHFGVRVPKNGDPVWVDLIQKEQGASGQLQISQIKPPLQEATNWSFKLSIPDGGVVNENDEYQFQAPESGYQSVVNFEFTKSDTNWTTQTVKQFYITFGQPRKYGWLRIESNLAQGTVFLTYSINPDGSRNLEPQ